MRKTEIVTVPMEGRDKGKTFLITEMGAMQGERWATRAMLVLGRSGVEVPDEIRGTGMAGIALYGLRALLRVAYDDAQPLLDEMLRCIKFIPDVRHPNFARDLVITNDGESDDVEEVNTFLFLRSKVFELHTGFSLADLASQAGAVTDETGNLSLTQTSPAA